MKNKLILTIIILLLLSLLAVYVTGGLVGVEQTQWEIVRP